MILKALAGTLSALLALILCWFGFDGARGGIAAAAGLVVLAGFVFFAYGLTSLLLLLRAWVSDDRRAWKLLATLAVLPFVALLVSSLGEDGLNARERIALAEVGGLLLLNVLCVWRVSRPRNTPRTAPRDQPPIDR